MKSISFGIKEFLENQTVKQRTYRIIKVLNNYDDDVLWEYILNKDISNWNIDGLNYSFPKRNKIIVDYEL
jgi:hypothetical protein